MNSRFSRLEARCHTRTPLGSSGSATAQFSTSSYHDDKGLQIRLGRDTRQPNVTSVKKLHASQLCNRNNLLGTMKPGLPGKMSLETNTDYGEKDLNPSDRISLSVSNYQ